MPDGRILVHDFGGCDVGDVLGAVGLDLSDLFPDEPQRDARGRAAGWQTAQQRRDAEQRRDAIHPADALACVVADAVLVAVIARDVADGLIPDSECIEELWSAAGRIAAAEGATHA